MNGDQGSHERIRDYVAYINQNFNENCLIRSSSDNHVFHPVSKSSWLLNGLRPELSVELRPEIDHSDDYFTWDQLVEAAQDAEWLWSLRHRKSRYYVDSESKRCNLLNFPVDSDGYVIVYTDGACLKNGQPDAPAGIGVWFGDGHFLNVSKPLSHQDPATNNVAEIKAVIEALLLVKKYGIERLAIDTDSQYLINSVTNWIFTWLINGWRKSDGLPLKHKKQFRELLLAMEDMDVKWVHVPGHSRNKGNDMADSFARQGAFRY